MNQLDEHQLRLHIPVVGWFLILQSALLALVAFFVFVLLMALSTPSFYAVLGESNGIDEVGSGILSFTAWAVGAFLFALAIPGLVAGIGLLTHQPWARVVSIVVAALGLINIPIGTVFGVYAIWVLAQDKAETYFRRGSQGALTPAFSSQ